MLSDGLSALFAPKDLADPGARCLWSQPASSDQTHTWLRVLWKDHHTHVQCCDCGNGCRVLNHEQLLNTLVQLDPELTTHLGSTDPG